MVLALNSVPRGRPACSGSNGGLRISQVGMHGCMPERLQVVSWMESRKA